jgi:uncharacterized protein
MENITGSAVVAGNYLDSRKFLVDELRKLVVGHSVVVEAPRRFGKTSVIKEFVRQEREKGDESRFLILFLELEGVETLDQFCFKLYRNLISLYDVRRYGEWLKTVLQDSWNAVATRIPSIGLPEIELELRKTTRDSDFSAWKERIDPLLAGLGKLDKEVVIVFDEFPDMLQNFNGGSEPLGFVRANDVLTAWLRSIRQTQQDSAFCHFVFCGSVNLRKTLEEAGLSKRMNDTETLRVPPMSPEEARLLLQTLATSYGTMLESAALDFMVAKTADGPPYYGQVLIKALRDSRRNEISFEVLKAIYDNMLRSGDHDLHHFDSRLDSYISSAQELSCSRIILRTLCNDVWHERELYDVAIADSRLDYAAYQKVVDRLIYEGYIKRDLDSAGKLSFLSPLLRDWWACKAGVR